MNNIQYPVNVDDLNKTKYRFNARSIRIIICYLLLFIIHSFADSHININRKTIDNILMKRQTYTFLVVGTDKKVGVNRTDTIILAFWDMKNKKINLINIPRDTRVWVEGHGWRKINAAYAYYSRKSKKRGIKMLIKAIKTFMDFRIDYYVLVDLSSFVKIIDVIGGIPIEIKRDMKYVDKAGGLKIDLKKGKQILDGDKAMQYVRYRGKRLGDIGRIARQQKFINAIIKKIKDFKTWMKIHDIAYTVKANIYTNMGISSMLGFAKEVLKIKEYSRKFHLLPGVPAYIDKVSYYVVDPGKLEILANEIMKGKKEKE
ncbi:LCP family protein [bacterium]|nr:LCP family protein [bacterium]